MTDLSEQLTREIMRPPLLPCQSFWGHRFEPRYSYEKLPGQYGPREISGCMDAEQMETFLRANQNKTYHGDVCVRCGQVVNKP